MRERSLWEDFVKLAGFKSRELWMTGVVSKQRKRMCQLETWP